MAEILTQIFCSVPGSNILVENPSPEPLLPQLQFIECATNQFVAHAFSWSRIPELYGQGHRRSLTLKASATHADMTDETALQLLQLAEEGLNLQIVDLTAGGDFLQNFRKRRSAQGA
jgi:hypothetical protein